MEYSKNIYSHLTTNRDEIAKNFHKEVTVPFYRFSAQNIFKINNRSSESSPEYYINLQDPKCLDEALLKITTWFVTNNDDRPKNIEHVWKFVFDVDIILSVMSETEGHTTESLLYFAKYFKEVKFQEKTNIDWSVYKGNIYQMEALITNTLKSMSDIDVIRTNHDLLSALSTTVSRLFFSSKRRRNKEADLVKLMRSLIEPFMEFMSTIIEHHTDYTVIESSEAFEQLSSEEFWHMFTEEEYPENIVKLPVLCKNTKEDISLKISSLENDFNCLGIEMKSTAFSQSLEPGIRF